MNTIIHMKPLKDSYNVNGDGIINILYPVVVANGIGETTLEYSMVMVLSMRWIYEDCQLDWEMMLGVQKHNYERKCTSGSLCVTHYGAPVHSS